MPASVEDAVDGVVPAATGSTSAADGDGGTPAHGASTPLFLREKHVRFFAAALHRLPKAYAALDTNRLTLVHFATHGLDLLGAWDDPSLCARYRLDKSVVRAWILGCLRLPGGFLGGTFAGPAVPTGDDDVSFCSERPPECRLLEYHKPHIAMTYCALLTLRVLDEDEDNEDNKRGCDKWCPHEDKSRLVESIRRCQRPDGSFGCLEDPSEQDMRFLYCACAISSWLGDWSGVDTDKAVEYVVSCRAYDGSIGLVPGQEGHGGSTFCALAALALMGRLGEVVDPDWKEELVRWCVGRQVAGMQGRPNKAEDTCYSYWIGGSLRLLGHLDDLLDHSALEGFVLGCQSPATGGFAKVRGGYPDLLHSYYSLAWLSLSNDSLSSSSLEGWHDETRAARIPLHALDCTLGIRKDRSPRGAPSRDAGGSAHEPTMATTGWVHLRHGKEFSRLLYPNPVCFLCTTTTTHDGHAHNNAMVVSWLSATNNHGRFVMSLNRRRHTANALSQPNQEFVLCVPVAGMEDLVLAVGSTSGRFGTKFRETTGHSSSPEEPGLPKKDDEERSLEATKSQRQKRKQQRREWAKEGIPGLVQVSLGSDDANPADGAPSHPFAIRGTVARLRCRTYSVLEEAVDDEHSLILAEVTEAYCREDYWDPAKKQFRPREGSEPYLTFLGSQTFGRVVDGATIPAM